MSIFRPLEPKLEEPLEVRRRQEEVVNQVQIHGSNT